jgi:hypothetical protein
MTKNWARCAVETCALGALAVGFSEASSYLTIPIGWSMGIATVIGMGAGFLARRMAERAQSAPDNLTLN